MKTLKITTDNKITIIDVDFSNYRALKRAVGGYVETVHTQNLYAYFKAPVMMLVDEAGWIRNRPVNMVASYFYGVFQHNQQIAGDVIFALSLGEDMIGLGDRDSEQWLEKMLNDFPVLVAEEK